MTKADLAACAAFPAITQKCPTGPSLKVIKVDSKGNVAIRLGHAPVKLSNNYSFSQLRAACGSSVKRSASTPSTASVSPLMSGTAHPVIPITPKSPQNVDLVFVGSPVVDFSTTTVPVEIWNGTSKTVSAIDVSGPAKDPSGKVIGSGDSQDIEPQNVLPGEVAFGMVYFETVVPTGSNLSGLSVTYQSGSSSFDVDIQVTQANYIAGQYGDNTMTGSVVNKTKTATGAPIETDAYCFSPSGTFLSVTPGFMSGNGGLAGGQSGGFSDTGVASICPTYLVGASGHSGS
jgi:hypothetical protein